MTCRQCVQWVSVRNKQERLLFIPSTVIGAQWHVGKRLRDNGVDEDTSSKQKRKIKYALIPSTEFSSHPSLVFIERVVRIYITT